MKLAILYSGGKDSTLAMHKVAEENEIVCLITMHSENKDSYMFHSSNIHLTELQAQALEIPLINFNTHGKKELELTDLKDSIKKAKDKFKFQGIVTGALHSDYQATRIQKICDDLNLKCINPLWHKDQESHLRDVLNSGFKIILKVVEEEGLTKEWLGKEITHEDIDKLVKLHNKTGFHCGGEGGEYESLVLDCPMYKKKLQILDTEIIMENKYTGKLIIKNAKLISK